MHWFSCNLIVSPPRMLYIDHCWIRYLFIWDMIMWATARQPVKLIFVSCQTTWPSCSSPLVSLTDGPVSPISCLTDFLMSENLPSELGVPYMAPYPPYILPYTPFGTVATRSTSWNYPYEQKGNVFVLFKKIQYCSDTRWSQLETHKIYKLYNYLFP
jgi:hypothetical protein